MNTTLRPFRPIRPGEILEEELAARGWNRADFAEIIGQSIQEVDEIISGNKSITLAIGVAFSGTLGTSAEYWINLEEACGLDSAQTNITGIFTKDVRRDG